jgi:hypothetical protein
MLSSATYADDIFIRAGIRAHYRPKYHCEKELNTMRDRINIENANPNYIAALKEKIALRGKVKGCGYVTKHQIDQIDNIVFHTCLCKLKHPFLYDFMFMNEQRKNGVLPFEGSLLNQPAQIIELLKITNDAIINEENEINKQSNRQAKVKHGKR